MLKFKTDQERDEWVQMGFKNPRLVDAIIDLADTMQLMFGKDITLTEVFRTPDEQTALYKDEAQKVAKSPHSFWKAVDIRSRDLTQHQIDFAVQYLNTKYKNASGRPVAIFHKIAGGADHIHVQLTD